MTWKKANIGDTGTGTKFGADDMDKVSNLFSGVDVDDITINSDWVFKDGKLSLRNPANTFSTLLKSGAVAADRTINLPAVTATDTLVTQDFAQTLTNKTIDLKSNPVIQYNKWKYVVFIDGSNTKCLDMDTGTIVSSNTSAVTTLQYAVDNAGGKPILIKRGTYALTSALNIVNKDVCLVGERVTAAGSSYSTVLSRSGAVIDCNSTDGTYARQHIENLEIDGVNKSGIGINCYDVKFNMPFIKNVYIKRCSTGMEFANGWYVNFFGLQIEDCGIGLHLTNDGTGGTLQKGCNTLYFYGGRVSDCDTYNLHAEVVNDVGFYATILESTKDFTNMVKAGNACTSLRLDKCSLEYTTANNETILTDDGSNNIYTDCRFENSGNTNYTAVAFTSGSKSNVLAFCRFGSDSTKTITITTAGDDNKFICNSRRRWTVPTGITFTDTGTLTTAVGNSFVGDRLGGGLQQKIGFFGTAPISKKGANADTSGATLSQLETEVNELKQLLRDYGLMA